MAKKKVQAQVQDVTVSVKETVTTEITFTKKFIDIIGDDDPGLSIRTWELKPADPESDEVRDIEDEFGESLNDYVTLQAPCESEITLRKSELLKLCQVLPTLLK